MPLRDHFRPPVTNKHTWDSFHGMWPGTIVRQLFEILPAGYVSAPNVHFGKEVEITLEADLSDQDEFEVRIYDDEHGRQLVAVIELVSPSNKDRPEHRRAFVAKVAALLQKDVCVSVVDLVTIRQFNLYVDLLELIGGVDPQLGPNPTNLYSVTIRSRKPPERRSLLDLWYYPMALGQTLPTLPIWLTPDLRVLLPLEAGYEETCRLLHIA
jgi:hypothetical protein